MNKPFAITLDPGSSRANRTGSWRTERPVYVDRLPPCNNQCPAGEDEQAQNSPGWTLAERAAGGDGEANRVYRFKGVRTRRSNER